MLHSVFFVVPAQFSPSLLRSYVAAKETTRFHDNIHAVTSPGPMVCVCGLFTMTGERATSGRPLPARRSSRNTGRAHLGRHLTRATKTIVRRGGVGDLLSVPRAGRQGGGGRRSRELRERRGGDRVDVVRDDAFDVVIFQARLGGGAGTPFPDRGRGRWRRRWRRAVPGGAGARSASGRGRSAGERAAGREYL